MRNLFPLCMSRPSYTTAAWQTNTPNRAAFLDYLRGGQGDEWFIGKNSGSIFYFDHDLGELSPERLADLHIGFPQFLQLMFLCQDWYAVMGSGQATPQGQEWFATLCRSIHADLPESYPFDYSELK